MDPSWVVTAAHCVDGKSPYRIKIRWKVVSLPIKLNYQYFDNNQTLIDIREAFVGGAVAGQCGLMISALDSGSSGPGFRPGRGTASCS